MRLTEEGIEPSCTFWRWTEEMNNGNNNIYIWTTVIIIWIVKFMCFDHFHPVSLLLFEVKFFFDVMVTSELECRPRKQTRWWHNPLSSPKKCEPKLMILLYNIVCWSHFKHCSKWTEQAVAVFCDDRIVYTTALEVLRSLRVDTII